MIKQVLLSSVAGVLLTIVFLTTPTANAACQGYCADKSIKDGCELGFAGCSMHYDSNGKLKDVDCFYSGRSCDEPAEVEGD